MSLDPEAEWDYVVVGSGAGGGTVAARLAESGFRVLLLEAGGDPVIGSGARMPEDYDVPAFHPFASENPAISWDFHVEHYPGPDRPHDWKRQPRGIWYPRASTLGGCTAHNAMILLYPHDSDWEQIRRLTGDDSWAPRRMRRWFRLMEDCHHRPFWRFLQRFGLDLTGHGWSGWLRTERAMPRQAFCNAQLFHLLLDSTHAAVRGLPKVLGTLFRWVVGQADPNDRRSKPGARSRVWCLPLTTAHQRRTSARERVLRVRSRHPDKLTVELNALATRVLFDGDHRAIGVEYRKGERLYRACAEPDARPGEVRQVRARREGILAGGAFNTPQLLMLSGVGPGETLAAHGIPVGIDLPGVGRNLQDRYEVGVVNRLACDWSVLKGARFEKDDPLFEEWAGERSGMYVSNGAAIAVSARSKGRAHQPADLFCMALLARFEGYFPGYSRWIADHHDYLTWAVLKAHTDNRAGVVTLASADPLDPPKVDFNYFEDGDDKAGVDLRAVVDGIRLARRLCAPMRRRGVILKEEQPGDGVDSQAELEAYVRANAWGHHASCTCAIGPRQQGGVLDGDFRVHGAKGLRVVDASVFPRIPGFFVASAIYMIAEKAADAIARAALSPSPPPLAGERKGPALRSSLGR